MFYWNLTTISSENLMLYTWQAQITIGVGSIALISLIVGTLDNKIGGQPIRNILKLKRNGMNYWEKIIFIIGLSIINIWGLIITSLPFVVVLFAASSYAVWCTIKETYEIIFNKEIYVEILKNHITENINKVNKHINEKQKSGSREYIKIIST